MKSYTNPKLLKRLSSNEYLEEDEEDDDDEDINFDECGINEDYELEETTVDEDTADYLKSLGVDPNEVTIYKKKAKMANRENEADKVAHTQWLKRGPNTYIPTDNSKTVKSVEPGVYDINYSEQIGFYLFKKHLNLDELIELPDPAGKEVLEGIKHFWTREDKFKEYGYSFRRGVLMYGIPGAGKSSIINLMCKHLIEEHKGVVFSINSHDSLKSYQKFTSEIFRVIQPKTHIITVIEDLDGLCQNKETETVLLNVLDGLEQLDRVVYIGTTNYVSRLSDRIKNRPNRFDIRIEVKPPSAAARKMYFEHKLKADDLERIDLDMWVKQTSGMTMAHLGEVIKSTAVLGNTFESTIERLKGMYEPIKDTDYESEFSQKIGFKKVLTEDIPISAPKRVGFGSYKS